MPYKSCQPRDMKLLSWTFHGLGNLQTVRDLKKLMCSNNHDIVFLMENKKLESEMQSLGANFW